MREAGRIDIFKELKINQTIVAKEIKIIGDDGKVIGIFPFDRALKMAQDKDLDLVEFYPSVCKIINYEKFRYSQIKHDRKKSKVTVKEIQIRANVSDHDLIIKIKSIQRFLNAGDSVKLLITSKGRQIAHPELNMNILRKVMKECHESIFEGLSQNGRQLSCMCRRRAL